MTLVQVLNKGPFFCFCPGVLLAGCWAAIYCANLAETESRRPVSQPPREIINLTITSEFPTAAEGVSGDASDESQKGSCQNYVRFGVW